MHASTLPPTPFTLDCLLPGVTGGFFSSLLSKLWSEKEMRILILGLDGAGKTTILYRLQVGEVVTTIPSELRWQSFDPYVPFSTPRCPAGWCTWDPESPSLSVRFRMSPRHL